MFLTLRSARLSSRLSSSSSSPRESNLLYETRWKFLTKTCLISILLSIKAKASSFPVRGSTALNTHESVCTSGNITCTALNGEVRPWVLLAKKMQSLLKSKVNWNLESGIKHVLILTWDEAERLSRMINWYCDAHRVALHHIRLSRRTARFGELYRVVPVGSVGILYRMGCGRRNCLEKPVQGLCWSVKQSSLWSSSWN